jgi:hypothetical protein
MIFFFSRASRQKHLTLRANNAELELGGPRVGRPEVGCPGSVVPGVSRLWSGLGPWQAPLPRPSRNRHQFVGFGIPADEAFVGRE